MPAIKDVARHAGLSVAAVSKYLKNPGSVRPDTRVRIESAIRALQYRPSPFARSLRTRRSGMIAVVVPDVRNPFFAELFDSIRIAARARGWLALLETSDDLQGLLAAVRSLSVGSVDGVIPCFLDDEHTASGLAEALHGRTPVIPVSWQASPQGGGTVLLDVRSGMRRMVRGLLDAGRVAPAYVGGPEDSTVSIQKLAGFRDALATAGLPVQAVPVQRGPFSLQAGHDAARSLLADPARRPDCLVAENDLLAVGCLRGAREMGVRVPDDLWVTGFDDIPLAAMVDPPLTTVSLPIREMGEAAVRLMAAALGVPEDAAGEAAGEASNDAAKGPAASGEALGILEVLPVVVVRESARPAPEAGQMS